MKKIFLAAVIAGLATPGASSGTALFSSADIHRPLAPQSIPEQRDFLLLIPDKDKAALLKTYRNIRSAWIYFTAAAEINDDDDWLYIEDLLEARRRTPEEPYAPCLLGSYLALHHKFAAAAAVTEESLRILQAIGERPSMAGADPLGDLHVRCGINLARYRLLLGDAEGALDQLSELPSLDRAQGPVAHKAYWWLSSLALAELGQLPVARLALDQAKLIESPSRGREASYYPQYFRQAGAVEKYLDSMLLWKEGHRPEAIAAMRGAVDAWARVGVESKFYDARTSLALFLAESGQINEAVEMLSKLRKAPVQGKMLRSETITYNLALIQADLGELDKAADLYREAIAETVKRSCGYFKTMASWVTEAQGCQVVEICEDFLVESYQCDLKKCSSYQRRMSQPSSPLPWFCDSLRKDRFVAAHNNLGDVYLRQAGKTGSPSENWLGQAQRQFRLALDSAAPGSETWHRVNLNLARTHLELSDRESFLATLGAGLSWQSAPVLAYVVLLETAADRLTASAFDARFYLDVVEDAWGRTPPGEIRARLETLASTLEEQGRPAEDKVLSIRARRLLSPEASLPIPSLPPLAEGTERLRDAILQGNVEDGRAAVTQVEHACPQLLDDASSCNDASTETTRDAMFLNGLWYLEQGDDELALAYFKGAEKLDPSWPLSRRYITQLEAAP